MRVITFCVIIIFMVHDGRLHVKFFVQIKRKEQVTMSEMLSKFSAYEMFNNFLPGVLLCGYVVWATGIDIRVNDVMEYVFVFCAIYLCGVVLSRLGALILQPIAKKTGLIDWSDGYYVAEKKDAKIQVLLKDFNMYGSLVVAAFVAMVATIWMMTNNLISIQFFGVAMLVGVVLMCVMAFSYRKQSKYITKRINNVIEENRK